MTDKGRGTTARGGRLPTGRIARTGGSRPGHRPGRAVGGHAGRQPGPLAGTRRRGENARTAALVNELVEQLGQMRGAAMKVGQMLSMVEFDGLPEDERSAADEAGRAA